MKDWIEKRRASHQNPPPDETREQCHARLKEMASMRTCGHGQPIPTCPSCLALLLQVKAARERGLIVDGD